MTTRRQTGPSDLVPAAAARRLLLAGCALDRTPARATRARVIALVRELGFVQVDSINSVERAHHLILHARLDGYEPAQLAHHTERSRRAFEHWTHDASVIRSDWLPWWTHRFERSRSRLRESAWMRERLGRQWRKTIAEVRGALEARGPLATRDFPRPPRAGAGWWDWSPHKAALEFLWRTGEVAIHARRGFEKVYDLSERVHGPLPAQPAREALVAWACQAALERLGAATPREIAHFVWAITPAEAGAWCAKAAKHGEIAAVRLERPLDVTDRAPRPGYARLDWRRAAERVEPDETPRLLAPFDPLIRERARVHELFGFNYRFEAFVPAAKRVHGYYTMPVLVGERLVSRLDLASDRSEGVLRVDRVWHEPSVAPRLAERAVRASAERLAQQLGLTLALPARRTGR
ncbi:MAG: winged helix-turn-helix domain-containing protein [Phycisphaerales bacterium]